MNRTPSAALERTKAKRLARPATTNAPVAIEVEESFKAVFIVLVHQASSYATAN
jgi:hypothetical protein